jgi:ribosomal-protein-serine acetyltransferase
MNSNLFEIKVDENLSLVIPNEDRATEIFHLIDEDRDHLRAWLPWVDATITVEDTRENLSTRIDGFDKKEQASFYGTLDGNFVASVGFITLKQGEGEIGYWLLSKYGGRGLMTSFVKACIDYGFEELALDRIVIKCAEGNIKSAGIPRRLSFTQSAVTEESRIRNGDEHQTLVFTLDRCDYHK